MSDGMTGLFDVGGYRLQRVEISNWGTFDSKNGGVHVLDVGGQNALLVGQNGAGKSTVVDAILTLLVRPGSRNYNVAAGGKQRERDERSYIRGAYGRSGRDEDNTADVKYLRVAGGHFSILLAVFVNGTGEAFTVAQVLHGGADGDVTKIYALARKAMSISGDLSGLTSTEKLRQQVEKRGFRSTTNYSDFHTWLCDLTNLRSKAIEMFNQTVALKDIRSLNAFIRDHMLESGKWEERIEQLQRHFQDLTEAHAALVRVQRQSQLLAPLKEKGEIYFQIQERMRKLRATVAALEFYFLVQAVELGNPKLDALKRRRAELAAAGTQLLAQQREFEDEVRRLTNEIENAGGQRARDLPREIVLEKERASRKREAATRVQGMLRTLDIQVLAWDAAVWEVLRPRIDGVRQLLVSERDLLQQHRDEAVGHRGKLRHEVRELEEEVTSLQRRRGNLPRNLDQVRRKLCEDLSLPVEELPFAAELVDVKAADREWQASIEMVLRGFALTMLVPRRHSHLVSRQVDGCRLVDDRGDGVRLHYEVIAEGVRVDRRQLLQKSMIAKLDFRQDHSLWTAVRAVIEERLDHRCCESVEEWQQSQDNAITKNRHVRTRNRHQKDDRNQAINPSNFVLGWDNAAKIRSILSDVSQRKARLTELEVDLARDQKALEHYTVKLSAAESLQAVSDFAEVDFGPHERRATELTEELRLLLELDESTRHLKGAKLKAEAEVNRLAACHYDVAKEVGKVETEESQVATLVKIASQRLREAEQDGSLPVHREWFGAVVEAVGNADMTFEQIHLLQPEIRRELGRLTDAASRESEEIGGELQGVMARFLKEFKEEEDDLRVGLDHLDSYLALYRRIAEDDLPRFTERFRSRLNDTMLDEIGLLNLDFTSAGNDIRVRVEQLNSALSQLEYRAGTIMRLECRPSKDSEITEFRQRLRDCTSNSFERTAEANEERFSKISKLLVALREEPHWRQRVTDVRRWYDFVAREIRKDDGSEVNFFQDGQGQSGGEKAKLAFTILVAALAYQYDLDPDKPRSDRFNFVVVDEMFSKVDDQYSKYAMRLFARFNLQLLVVAPLDAKARVTEEFVGCYLHVVKDPHYCTSEVFHMTAAAFSELSAVSDPQTSVTGV